MIFEKDILESLRDGNTGAAFVKREGRGLEHTPIRYLEESYMKTLLRSLLVLTLTVSAGACTSTILGPSADAGAHHPDPGP